MNFFEKFFYKINFYINIKKNIFIVYRVMHDTAVWYFLYHTSQLLPNKIAHAYLKFKTALNSNYLI